MRERTSISTMEVGTVRAKVLAAAARVLEAEGPDRVSLRAIAELAGIAPASIYHHFENKDELLLSLAIVGHEEVQRAFARSQRDLGAGEPMRAAHAAFFDYAREHPALFSLMFSTTLLSRHAKLRAAENETYLAYEAVVRADPRIPADRKEPAARAIWALGRGISATMASYPDGQLPPDIAETLFAGTAYLIDHRDAP